MMQEEIFGPLFPMHTYKNLDEALEYITTEHDKPLVVYYFGKKNGSNMMKVRDNTSSGTFVCNETIYQILNTDLPFGGVGGSGYGRTHGLQGFQAFSNMKSCLVKPSLDCFPFNAVYPPYTDEVKGQILKTLKMGVVT